MMDILLVNRHYNSNDIPTGRMLGNLVEELTHSGHKIRVLTSSSSYTNVSCKDTDNRHSEKIIYLPTLSERKRFLSWGLFWLQACFYILCSQWERCLLMTDPPFSVTIAWLVRLFHNRKRNMYWWTMDLYPEALAADGLVNKKSFIYLFLRWLNECGLSSLTGIICLDLIQQCRLKKYRNWRFVENNCTVIPPWDYRPLPMRDCNQNRFLEKYGLQNKHIVLYAGNLGAAHSYTELIQAAKEFKHQELYDWQFVFVCRGVRRKSLEKESSELANVLVLDYQPEELISDLLWAANVHVITMQPGWDGIVVPSKLYGILKVKSPVLFIGPEKSATADEILRYGAGISLPVGTDSKKIVETLLELRKPEWIKKKETNCDGAKEIARFITK